MPKDYQEVREYGEYTPLELGGHICKIMKVEETKSKTAGKEMLVISLDIAEGPQKDYYTEKYRQDTNENKKWGCNVYQLVYDVQGNTNRGFKSFITAVEKSNNNFKVQWGEKFADCFKGKLIGGVFGREEYIDAKNEFKFATKCFFFRSTDAIRAGVEVPKDKLLKKDMTTGFTKIEDDDGLPF
jgi:hypothetical protein